MRQLPKAVRDRLAAQQSAGTHPDADVLNLFCEGGVVGRERESVLAHLAVCPSCRDVVALASTPISAEAAPVRYASHGWGTRWFTWPRLRWVATAAAVLVVGTAILLRESEERRRGWDGEDGTYPVAASRAEQAGNTTEGSVKAEAKDGSAAKQTANKVEADARSRSDRKPMAGSGTVAAEEALKGAPQRSALTSQSSERRSELSVPPGSMVSANTPQAPPPPPVQKMQSVQVREDAANGPVGVVGGALTAPQRSTGDASKLQVAQDAGRGSADQLAAQFKAPVAAPQAQSQRQAYVNQQRAAEAPQQNAAGLAKAKSADAAAMSAKKDERAQVVSGPVINGRLTNYQGAVMAANVRANASVSWSITESGVLERSSDHGQTWQSRQPASGVSIRAVASLGVTVWGGGPNGILYRSRDAGEHWEKMSSPTKEDIVHLEMVTEAQVLLTDATGARWGSEDGGATWTQINPEGRK